MNSKAQRPAIEIAVEWIAAISFGGAIGFAVWALALLGAGVVSALAAGLVGAIGAWFVMRSVDRAGRPIGEQFVPVDFTDDADVLMLDDQLEPDDALLLDDPLPAINEDSRVVRLFAVPATVSSGAAPLPAPGEMATRIEAFLEGTRPVPAAHDAAAQRMPPAADASAALHAALADIRRSLRQA